jgi:Carboxypeptidase regulatory-like domain
VTSTRMNTFISKMGSLLVLLAFATAACLPTRLAAQELSGTKGGLQGSVTDSSGAVVPGATVTITGNSDTRKTTTNDAGHWEATSLTPGPYAISIEREGFSTTVAKSIVVEIGRVNAVNLILQTGAVAQTVQVDATAVGIDTTSTALGSNLTNTFYSQVPVARNVGSLFYTAPGAANSGGTGTANPSIEGSTGLENQYIADGVNITDAGYGGLGVFSPIYGSLGTGINLTFIQEVQVKTGAFEPQYGKGDGGVIQIVTKSGGTSYHGAVAAFFAPDGMSAGQRYADDYFDRVNVHGHIASEPQYDASAEFGGYVPGEHLKNRLFFFGAYNPALNRVYWLAPSVAGIYSHGPYTNNTTVNSWAAKVTFKINDATNIDASAFADPSRTNAGYGIANEDTFPFYPNLNLANETGFSRWNYGSQSETLHLTSSLSPTWQLNIAASAKRSNFDEVGLQNVYNITDYTGQLQPGVFTAQGLGYTQNPITHDYGFQIDTEKTLLLFGSHTFSIGWGFNHNIYDLAKNYSGESFTFPSTNSAGIGVGDISNSPLVIGASTSAAFKLEEADDCPICPTFGPNKVPVYLDQNRGLYSGSIANASQSYHAIYGNDNYTINRYITLNLGIRWDEEQINGVVQQYTFNDNWSPRLGINVDPFGDRKSKIFFNFGRYTQQLPDDAAIRELNQELDVYRANWMPAADANGNAVISPDGTVVPVLDAAHLLSGNPAAGPTVSSNISVSGGGYAELIAPHTKLNFEEEYVGGIERQYKGFALSARYMDRRLLRAIDDMSGASPEGNLSGNVPQNFIIGNPSAHADYFVNEVEVPYQFVAGAPNDGAPASCVTNYNAGIGDTPFINSAAQVAGSGGACGQNVDTAGIPTPDGKPDGAPNVTRHYQSFELEANKNFSHGFMLRVNYRYAKLFGNYEGLYRNDNGQSDPGLTSLFDFTLGVLGMLGDQYKPGYLNTDRRQTGNLYGSYVIPRSYAKNLDVGVGFHGSSGTPITNLGAHPVYDNSGEIPLGGRGAFGTTASNYQLDLHLDYPLPLGEKYRIKFSFDTFNVTNSRSLTAVDQDSALSYGNTNVDFLKPVSFQRAFYGRGSVRFEF